MSKHLKEVGLTYGEHFKFAFKAGVDLIWAGTASIIHAFLPEVFAYYPPKIVKKYNEYADHFLAFEKKKSEENQI